VVIYNLRFAICMQLLINFFHILASLHNEFDQLVTLTRVASEAKIARRDRWS